MRWHLVSLALLVVGCSGSDDSRPLPGRTIHAGAGANSRFLPPPSGVGVEGDWFVCLDLNCRELRPEGFRVQEGFFYFLLVFDLQRPLDGYCFSTLFFDEPLPIRQTAAGFVVGEELEGEGATAELFGDGNLLRLQTEDEVAVAARLLPARYVFRCEDEGPVAVPIEPPPNVGGPRSPPPS